MTYYLKNTSGNPVSVSDLGLYLPSGQSITIDSNNIDGYLSADMATQINAGNLILSTTDVGDNGGDMTSANAIKALTLVSAILTDNPNQVTFTQASDADPNTDITALEAETLTNGSDAGSLHNHNGVYYTKTNLQTSGQAQVHWENLINTPAFGAMQWIEPVICTLHGFSDTPPSSPQEGWFYIDTDNNHLYKYVGTSWVDQGAPENGDRVIYRDGASSDDKIYEYSTTTSSWGTGIAPVDNLAVLVEDDGDGRAAQYAYSDNELPPDWIKIADVNWGDHSVLSNRDAIDSHPASAISYVNTTSGLTASTVQDALDEIVAENGISLSNVIYVAKNGNDTTGDGTLTAPYLTVQAAITAVPTVGGEAASSTNKYGIFVFPGDYLEAVTLNKSWVYLVGLNKLTTKIKTVSGNTLSLSVATDSATGVFNLSIESTSSSTTDNAVYITGNNPLIQDVIVDAPSGSRGIYVNGAYNQTIDQVIVKNGEVRIDAGVVHFNHSSVKNGILNVTNGTIIINDGDFSYNGGNAIEQANGTVYLVSAKLSSGASNYDYNQAAGTVYWGWVEYNPTKISLAGTKALIYIGKDLSYDHTASGLTAVNVQDAIDELDGRIDTDVGNLSSHTGSTSNPHSTTLTQAVSADVALDANLTVANLTTLVDDSNADDLHVHASSAVTFDNTASGMSATNVKAALDELDGRLDTAAGSLSSHTSNILNPHSTTLTQAISADSGSDSDLTVINLNTLVDDSNADLLHTHDASNIAFTPGTTGLSSNTVQGAIAELDALVDSGIGRGTSFPSTPLAGDLFFRTDRSLLYQYDGNRSAWLSISQMFLDWGSNSASGVYLNIHGATATQTGYLMPRNGKIIGVTAKCASGNLSKALEIRRNNNSSTPLKTFSLSSGSYSSIIDSIDFVAGDYIQAFASSSGTAARDVVVMVTVSWS